MTRIRRGYVARKRRNSILKLTSGFRHSNLFRPANQEAMKAMKYSYRDRLKRKRDFRRLWITRINAIARDHDLTYSVLINKLHLSQVLINRKTLAQIAILDSKSFSSILESLKVP